MTLTLKIDNLSSLPDGGPMSVSIRGKRGLDIGRDQYLDWTLPDPSRFISGKHCEIRWHDDGYWLHDISTNGTYLDGAEHRLKAPHKLRDGDRFAVGHYIIAVTLAGEGFEDRAQAQTVAAAPAYDDLWTSTDEAAPPIDPRLLKAPRDLAPVKSDFLNWAVDVPAAAPHGSSAGDPWDAPGDAGLQDESWARATPQPPPAPPEVIAVPAPRRPVWVSGEPNGPWAAPAVAPAPPPAGAAGHAAARPDPDAGARPSTAGMVVARRPDPGEGAAMADFLRLVARGAGLPEDAFASRDPAELAEELGEVLRLVSENTRQLLDARQQAKRLSRSVNQTMIQAVNNNPLKFAPTADEAIGIMFGAPGKSYLDARRAFTQSFNDLKAHQLKTFSSMQQALKLLLGELDPDVIADTAVADRGLAGVMGSRKARLWDAYVARWQARTTTNKDGMLSAFMDYFAACYDHDGP